MMFASVGSRPVRRSRPNSAPRNATSSMNAVTVALSSAPGYGADLGEADPVVAQERVDQGLRRADQAVREAPCHRLRRDPRSRGTGRSAVTGG